VLPVVEEKEITISYLDMPLTCSDCRGHFTFSAEDQGLSAELGYDQPVCCRRCRLTRESSRRDNGRLASALRFSAAVPLP